MRDQQPEREWREQHWSDADIRLLKRRYKNEPTATIANDLGRTLSSVYQKARNMGLAKSDEFMASAASGRLTGESVGTRFKKGERPWNLGLKAVNGYSATRFKPGHKPINTWVPVGSESITKDGILERKVSDTGDRNVDWRSVHTLIWESINGPMPAGNIVIFADGNRRNFDPSNLQCLTRAELMQRNSVHRYPRELKHAMRLVKKLKRAIGERFEKQK